MLKLGMTYPLPLEAIRAFAGKVETLRGDRRGRPVSGGCRAGGGHRGRSEAGDVPLWRVERRPRPPHSGRRRLARARAARRAPRPACARDARTASCSRRCTIWTASSPATSAAIRWACCRPSRRWTRWCAWAPPSGSASACGTRFRPKRPAAWSASSATAPSSTAESRDWWRWSTIPPPGGHLLIILDNGTTAMTGLQEHPGTGRTLDHQPTGKVRFEELARSLGFGRVHVRRSDARSRRLPGPGEGVPRFGRTVPDRRAAGLPAGGGQDQGLREVRGAP